VWFLALGFLGVIVSSQAWARGVEYEQKADGRGRTWLH
jgi:hypothetical protein